MTKTLLAFDTSTNACSVALLHGCNCTDRFEIAPRRHTDLVLSMIDELLGEAGITIRDVTGIAYGCGPGSFMGARLATSIAQGLAYGVGCEVMPVSSLQVLAQQAHREHGVDSVLAAWDARMGEIYWGSYQVDVRGLMVPYDIEDRLSAPVDITVETKGRSLVGNAWSVYSKELANYLIDNADNSYTDIYPHSAAILELARTLMSEKSVKPLVAEPVYLRHNVAHCRD